MSGGVTLYVARGIPGLGKAEWAREVVGHGHGRIVRISPQILRADGFGRARKTCAFQERIIDSAVRAQALVFLLNDISVITHGPYLQINEVDRWVVLAEGITSVKVEIHDFGGNLRESSERTFFSVREMAERYRPLPQGYKNRFKISVKVRYH